MLGLIKKIFIELLISLTNAFKMHLIVQSAFS